MSDTDVIGPLRVNWSKDPARVADMQDDMNLHILHKILFFTWHDS